MRATSAIARRLLPAVIVALLGPAGTASAAVLGFDGTRYGYTAEPGETNDLRVLYHPADGEIVFDDRVTILGDGSEPVSCTYVMGDTTEVSCPLTENPRIDAGDMNDIVEGGFIDGGPEEIHGGSGDDLLRGVTGDDLLDGGPGNDDLEKGGPNTRAGNDLVIGGAGDDTAWYTGDYGAGTEPVTVRLDDQANDGPAGQADNVQTENVNGSEQADVLIGDGGPNHLDGGDGGDEVHGGGGGDFVDGGVGEDRVFGGGGDDKVYGGDSANDLVDGGPGRDELAADGICFYSGCNSGGNDRVQARDGEQDTIDCGGGYDTGEADGIDNFTGGLCEAVERPGGAGRVGGGGVASFTLHASSRIKRAALGAHGLLVTVRCAGPCGIDAVLLLARPTARRLGLARAKALVVGRARKRLARAGTAKLRMRPNRKARRRLRARRALTLTLRVSVTQAGRTTTKAQPVVVRP